MSKKTFAAVKAAKGELIVQIKENQKELYREVAEACAFLEPLSQDVCLGEKGRNRIETREVYVFDVSSCLIESAAWSELIGCAICVRRITELFSTQEKRWIRREEIAYYAASHIHEASFFAKYIRDHWRTENVHHYVRDVAMREDASRVRVSSGIFARLRSFALNILRFNQVRHIKPALFENALSFDLIKAYQGILN